MLGKHPWPPGGLEAVCSRMKHDKAAIMRFMRLTGLRSYEARNLLVGHILDRNGEYLKAPVLRVTKGGRPRRVWLTPEVIAILEELRKAYGGHWGSHELAVFRRFQWTRFELMKESAKARTLHYERLAIGKRTTPKPHRGKRNPPNGETFAPLGIHKQALIESVRKAVKESGLDPDLYATHSCRKSFAKDLLDSGATLIQIRDLLGHSSIAMTEKYLETLSTTDAFAVLARVHRPRPELAAASSESEGWEV